jgi:hypothetical protein
MSKLFKEYVKFFNRLYDITWFGAVYAFNLTLRHTCINEGCGIAMPAMSNSQIEPVGQVHFLG